MRVQIRGVFHATGGRMLFATGTKGGVWHKKLWGWNTTTFLELFCFLWFCPYYSASIMTNTEKSGKTIATPPRNGGGHAAPCSGAMWHAPTPAPKGSLSSVFIPAGRLGKDAPERRGLSGEWPYGIAKDLSETDHGLEPVLAPGGRADELEKPRPRGGQESPFPSPWMIPDRSSPSRVRFAAARPGRLRADPKDALLTRKKRGVGPWGARASG